METTIDYPWMNEDYDAIKEAKPLPGGSEVQLEIILAEPNDEKQYIAVAMRICDTGELGINPALTTLLNHYHTFKVNPDPVKQQFKQQLKKEFIVGFGIEKHEWNSPDTWIGKKGWNLVELEAGEGQYRAKNTLGQFVTKP